jgi:hypothetical protein
MRSCATCSTTTRTAVRRSVRPEGKRSCSTGSTTTRTAGQTAQQPSLPEKDRISHSRGRLGAVLVKERELCRLVGMVVSLHAHRGVRLVRAQRGPEHLDRTRLQDPAQREGLSACSIRRHTAAHPAHAAPATPRPHVEWQPVRWRKAGTASAPRECAHSPHTVPPPARRCTSWTTWAGVPAQRGAPGFRGAGRAALVTLR